MRRAAIEWSLDTGNPAMGMISVIIQVVCCMGAYFSDWWSLKLLMEWSGDSNSKQKAS
jgi:hypothetical protein